MPCHAHFFFEGEMSVNKVLDLYAHFMNANLPERYTSISTSHCPEASNLGSHTETLLEKHYCRTKPSGTSCSMTPVNRIQRLNTQARSAKAGYIKAKTKPRRGNRQRERSSKIQNKHTQTMTSIQKERKKNRRKKTQFKCYGLRDRIEACVR